MIIKVIGKRSVSFKGTDGNEVSGKTVYFVYNDDRVDGVAPDKTFVRSGRHDPFEIGKEYNVSYMRNGKIDLDNIENA